jgi:hypothetical protein
VLSAGRGVWAVEGRGSRLAQFDTREAAHRDAVDRYRVALLEGHPDVPTVDEVRRQLAGRVLMCWCPLELPCHADVLLAVAAGADLEDGAR